MQYLTAEEMLAGAQLEHDREVPADLLAASGGNGGVPARVRIRPLTVKAVQQITRAAKENDTLLSALIIKESLVEPRFTLEQAYSLPAGLARFLIGEINLASGLEMESGSLESAVEAPMARACFHLAREFGWSPKEMSDLTVGQIMMYLEMLRQNRAEVPSEV